MTVKPETKLSNNVLLHLRAHGGWWLKVHGGIFQAAGIPDIIGCWKGRFIAIELKEPGNVASKLQSYVLLELHNAGAYVGVAYSIHEAFDIRDHKKIYAPDLSKPVDISEN